jgi:hypothetical protein
MNVIRLDQKALIRFIEDQGPKFKLEITKATLAGAASRSLKAVVTEEIEGAFNRAVEKEIAAVATEEIAKIIIERGDYGRTVRRVALTKETREKVATLTRETMAEALKEEITEERVEELVDYRITEIAARILNRVDHRLKSILDETIQGLVDKRVELILDLAQTPDGEGLDDRIRRILREVMEAEAGQ